MTEYAAIPVTEQEDEAFATVPATEPSPEDEQQKKTRELCEEIKRLKIVYCDEKIKAEMTADVIAPLDAELQAAIDKLTAEHKAKHAEAYRNAETYKADFATTNTALREALCEYYELSGQKTFDDNLSTKVTVSYDVDQAKAVEWAESNCPVAVKKVVDENVIVSMHKTTPLEFVYATAKVSAVIKGLGK